jgi:hypothetical protein
MTRHQVLVLSTMTGGVAQIVAQCTTEGCGWQEKTSTHREAQRAASQHNPRCEAVTPPNYVGAVVRCQRMALHPGDHEHTVRWP